MIPTRKLNIISLQMKSFNEYFAKRKLGSVVVVSKHFTERFHQRNIDLLDVYAGMKYIADNICLILYETECGDIPHVQYKDIKFVLEKIDKHVYLKTIYKVQKRSLNADNCRRK